MLKKIDKFISMFNDAITKGHDSNGSFYLNTSLDHIPMLSNIEFDHASKLAKDQGWDLTWSGDNYQTINYRMKKI